jgi:hypothetical protein
MPEQVPELAPEQVLEAVVVAQDEDQVPDVEPVELVVGPVPVEVSVQDEELA